jgi:hypothetical protein
MTKFNQTFIQDFLKNPRESLDIEIKRWFSPTTPEGKAKIAKACIALRNNNGGLLIIGICDNGLQDVTGAPAAPEDDFHIDAIQEIVSKYSSLPFEISVEFHELTGIKHPVIRVGAGVQTPVACKSDLSDRKGGKLLQADAIYVRTLNSNNRVSSSVARWKDLEAVTRFCMDNREADIGRFIRRHLTGLDLSNLIAALVPGAKIDSPEISERTGKQLLDDGYRRFEGVMKARGGELGPSVGTYEAGVLIDGERQIQNISRDVLWRIDAATPRHTGWPPWVVLSARAGEPMRPYVLDNGWQALLSGTDFIHHLDFWRIDAKGRLYQIRALEDDMPSSTPKPEPGTSLDFLLQISRTAEFVSAALAIAGALEYEASATSLEFYFRWRGLKGRRVTSWVQLRYLVDSDVAQQDSILTHTRVPMDINRAVLSEAVETLVSPVFAMFGGLSFPISTYEHIVGETINRRM